MVVRPFWIRPDVGEIEAGIRGESVCPAERKSGFSLLYN